VPMLLTARIRISTVALAILPGAVAAPGGVAGAAVVLMATNPLPHLLI